MNLKGFLKNRKRRKQREREFENAIHRATLLNLKLADLKLLNAVQQVQLEHYLQERLSRKDDYSR
jgi:hypothetical protein